MQAGGGGGGSAGGGRNPAGKSPSSSSSSSSAIQQHLQFQQRQPQLRKPDEEAAVSFQGGGIHGSMTGGSFHSSSSAAPFPPNARTIPQSREEGQVKVNLEHAPPQVQQAYLQYVFQNSQAKAAGSSQSQQQMKPGMVVPPSKDQDMRLHSSKMQEIESSQASNQVPGFKKSIDQPVPSDKQLDQGQCGNDNRSELKNSQGIFPHLTSGSMIRPMTAPQHKSGMQSISNNQLAMLQQLQAWALENNIDLSHPSSANLISQLIPQYQSKFAAMQKSNEGNSATPRSRAGPSKQPPAATDSSNIVAENSAHGNLGTEGQSGSSKPRQSFPPTSFSMASGVKVGNTSPMLPANAQGRDNRLDTDGRQSALIRNNMPVMHFASSPSGMGQNIDGVIVKNSMTSDAMPMQYLRQMQQLKQNSVVPSTIKSEGHPSFTPLNQPQKFGFTTQQLHVLKAQILAFRRLKKGDGILASEVFQSMGPPPQSVYFSPAPVQDGSASQSQPDNAINLTSEKMQQVSPSTKGLQEEETVGSEEKTIASSDLQSKSSTSKQVMRDGSGKEVDKTDAFVKSEQGQDLELQKNHMQADIADRVKSIQQQPAVSDDVHKKNNIAGPVPVAKDIIGMSRKYNGPLFDLPSFSKKNDAFGPGSAHPTHTNPLTIGYDLKELVLEEAKELRKRRRENNLKKIRYLLAMNSEQKLLKPDVVLRLHIEEKKFTLMELQARLRNEIEQQQQEIMAMPDRPYRKFVRQCERQRVELVKQVQLSQKAMREKQLKFVFQWRKKLLEAHWAIRDARTARNRGVAKYHERMLREFSKRKDEDRNKRMEALKNNDVDRYREMLLEQQTNMPGDAAQRYSVLSSFLSQTEDYLQKLGGKITTVKYHQEAEEAAIAAAAAARTQGLSEEEVKAAASCAGEEVLIRNRFSEMNAPKDSSVNKYYKLAHAVNERVLRQPAMLKAGTLRDYQLVGLQWMLSLYNNKLNGILADEMGLGKTVQVMALMAYLMEFKGNYGPHLIIVPNAVMVNWKSELHTWLPSVSCIYYVGGKEERLRLYTQDVCAMKFNALVTTYEFVMNDRAKLSKVDWKYIIIDEAQRMKNRNSRLARDLDRYRCQRRLLLTGTPLQNDLKELWSLLNLLLPEVFDNRKAFHDWFSQPFQKDGASQSAEDDWLETEKKVIIIHRLHQILEPFMLRRRVEDVEGSLPQKVSVVLRCRMSAVQGAIYDWIKSTGSKKADPQEEKTRQQRNPNRQVRSYVPLQNRCMELHKVCNHPLLCYPYLTYSAKDYLIRSCGKLWMLDRILVKLHRTGHRVLLFSTMTRLLDILEDYLQWRRLTYRRIDGTTSLDDRESAIVDFNSPGTNCFIFLLSIRAAGRGLNLQTADTVIIYDPDANPKNEEQAVARAHRIGQKNEVKVIYMEAVVDTVSSYQKEDELRSGMPVDLEDDLAGKDRYMGSIESLVRNNIQQYKIDMADEVINAGRFDQRTTQEERRMTLESLLRDEERYQETVHDVPSLQEVNRMIARSKQEIEMFDQMDEEWEWPAEMIKFDEVPKWLRASTREVNAVITSLSKKTSAGGLIGIVGVEAEEEETASPKIVKKRGRPKGSKSIKKVIVQRGLVDGEENETSSNEKNGYAFHDEDEEIGEPEDDDFSKDIEETPNNKGHYDDDTQNEFDGGSYDFSKRMSHVQPTFEEAVSSGSSSGCKRVAQVMTPNMSSQKFGSLSALDAKPGSISKERHMELEEGEIAVSGDSHMDLQQSGSWAHERDECEDEQVLQPKIKRKRSIRLRPRGSSDKVEDKFLSDKASYSYGNSPQLLTHLNHGFELPLKATLDVETSDQIRGKNDSSEMNFRQPRPYPSRKGASGSNHHLAQKHKKIGNFTGSVDDSAEISREGWDSKSGCVDAPASASRQLTDSNQKKCKSVLGKLQRAIDKDGHILVPTLIGYLRRSESRHTRVAPNVFDLQKIDLRLDKYEYGSIGDFAADVQLMVNIAAQAFGYSLEARADAKKLCQVFLNMMKGAFPDNDLREGRSTHPSTSSGIPASSPSPRLLGQSRMLKQFDDSDLDLGSRSTPHGSAPATISDISDRTRSARLHKVPKPVSGAAHERNAPDEGGMLAHPGDLVVCKKKRKDREKSAGKFRMAGVIQPIDNGRRGQFVQNIPKAPTPQPSRQPNRWLQSPVSDDTNEAQWARPVKRLRTDAGKRRPSHM